MTLIELDLNVLIDDVLKVKAESASLQNKLCSEGKVFPVNAEESNMTVIHWRLFSSLQNKLGAIRQFRAE